MTDEKALNPQDRAGLATSVKARLGVAKNSGLLAFARQMLNCLWRMLLHPLPLHFWRLLPPRWRRR